MGAQDRPRFVRKQGQERKNGQVRLSPLADQQPARGGSQKPTLATNWDNYKKAGPLLISLDHPGTKDGKPIRVFFTDVAVKLASSNAWSNTQ